MQVVTDLKQALVAYRALKRQLTAEGSRNNRTIGYPGGHEDNMPLYWIEKHGVWAHLNDHVAENRFWICFGTSLQPKSVSHTITVECNPPKEGINRRTAGAFLIDGSDLFFAHSGKIGGGKKGIGKNSFLDWYNGGGRRGIDWPDGATSDLIIIGRIGSREFPSQLARFVRQVEAFKQGVGGDPPRDNKTLDNVDYNPEFSGTSRRSANSKPKDATYSHGIVVDALRALFPNRKLVGNDRHRDLYCVDDAKQLTALFEVKTSVDTTAVYTGIGQLLVHSAGATTATRVLVLPGTPQGKLSAALSGLGIRVLSYALDDGRVTFAKPEKLFKELFP